MLYEVITVVDPFRQVAAVALPEPGVGLVNDRSAGTVGGVRNDRDVSRRHGFEHCRITSYNVCYTKLLR